MIHVAAITDERLKWLVGAHRDKAGAAARIVSAPKGASQKEAEQLYAAAQNGWADVCQELLDRRHFVQPSTVALRGGERSKDSDGGRTKA